MEETEQINLTFLSNLNYVLIHLKKAIEEANFLGNEKIYLELSKDQIKKYLNYVYTNIKCWKYRYESKNYELIISSYKVRESITTQLELCLADYNNIFHIEGISYSIFQIGKVLLKKESNKSLVGTDF